jgi:succinate dehydrogenase/fumarate reductase flavoprotein subunit
MNDFDVVVVGSGAAGLCCALEAARAGAGVLIIDGEATVGGSSRLSGGIIMGAGTRFQRAQNIDDSPEDLFHEYMTFNQWKIEPGLAWRLAREAGPTIEWLADEGVSFLPELYPAGKERVPRSHVPDEAGHGVVDVLHAKCKQENRIEFALGRRIDRLLYRDDRVYGVAVGGDEVSATAVALATGGLGAAPDLLRKWWPAGLQAEDWTWYIGAAGARGDALALGEQVGAQIVGEGRGVVLLQPNFGNNIEVYYPGWLVIVNADGRRFYDETSSYSITQPVAGDQRKPIHAIWDDAAMRASRGTDDKSVDIPSEVLTSSWTECTLLEMLERGVVVRADSIEQLATAIGTPPENLAGTISAYNADIADGYDRSYRKDPQLARQLTTAPFYATELRLASIGLTAVGLRINADGEVLNEKSEHIPGLFAGGECTGGVIGDVYMGTGNAYANAVVFGRVAGRSAAAYVRDADNVPLRA